MSSSYLTFLALGVFIVVIITNPVFGDQPDPCSIARLKFAIESPDIFQECGEELVIDSTVDIPKHICYPKAEQTAKYILVMVDPDVPGKTPNKPYTLHWLVENIPGSNLTSGDWAEEEQFDAIMGYAGPAPPGNDAHRYQFYVYKQPSEGEIEYPDIHGKFMKFDLDGFVEENNLGAPAAGFEYSTHKSDLDEI